MKTYIATGENIGELEETLREHNMQVERFKHFNVLAVSTEKEYSELRDLCKPQYHIHEETFYDTAKH